MNTVIALPGAAAAPVTSPKIKGRYPPNVIPFCRLQLKRAMRKSEVAGLALQVVDMRSQAQHLRSCAAKLQAAANLALHEAATWEAKEIQATNAAKGKG